MTLEQWWEQIKRDDSETGIVLKLMYEDWKADRKKLEEEQDSLLNDLEEIWKLSNNAIAIHQLTHDAHPTP